MRCSCGVCGNGSEKGAWPGVRHACGRCTRVPTHAAWRPRRHVPFGTWPRRRYSSPSSPPASVPATVWRSPAASAAANSRCSLRIIKTWMRSSSVMAFARLRSRVFFLSASFNVLLSSLRWRRRVSCSCRNAEICSDKGSFSKTSCTFCAVAEKSGAEAAAALGRSALAPVGLLLTRLAAGAPAAFRARALAAGGPLADAAAAAEALPCADMEPSRELPRPPWVPGFRLGRLGCCKSRAAVAQHCGGACAVVVVGTVTRTSPGVWRACAVLWVHGLAQHGQRALQWGCHIHASTHSATARGSAVFRGRAAAH